MTDSTSEPSGEDRSTPATSAAAHGDPPRLVGMVHLPPLPGSPRFAGNFEGALEGAVVDAQILAEAGFDALMIENYGDVPFYADDVPDITVASMARAVATVRAAVDLPLGVNVLRNDGLAALSIAAACDAQFIRVNVLSGSMYTDQGLISGRAADLLRARSAWAADVEILADVFVKHASPPAGLTIEEAAADTFQRGLADALIVSGVATGKAPDQKMIERVRKAVPEATILIGSGSTRRTAPRLLSVADGLIVGTDVKVDGRSDGPVDPKRAAAMVKAATPSKAGGSKAGSPKAGSPKAGSPKAGGSKAGGSKAGGSKAGGSKAGGSKAGGSKAGGAKAGSAKAGGRRSTVTSRTTTRRSR